jgi:hypothetical protein
LNPLFEKVKSAIAPIGIMMARTDPRGNSGVGTVIFVVVELELAQFPLH